MWLKSEINGPLLKGFWEVYNTCPDRLAYHASYEMLIGTLVSAKGKYSHK